MCFIFSALADFFPVMLSLLLFQLQPQCCAVQCWPTCFPSQTLPTALGETTRSPKAECRGIPGVPLKYRCRHSTGVQPPGNLSTSCYFTVCWYSPLEILTAPYLYAKHLGMLQPEICSATSFLLEQQISANCFLLLCGKWDNHTSELKACTCFPHSVFSITV